MDDHRLMELEEDQEGSLEDEDSEDEEEEDYEEEEAEELIPAEMTSPSIADCTTLLGAVRIKGNLLNDMNGGGKEQLIRGEIEGLFCPICHEAWSNGGEHRMCCLPCGHIYELSCIKKWLQRRRASGKCPQCNALCTLKDVRLLYANRLCASDEDLHKRVCLLEAKCAHLEKKAMSHEKIVMQGKQTAYMIPRQTVVLGQLKDIYNFHIQNPPPPKYD